MRTQHVVIALFAVLATVSTPLLIAKSLQLGSYAKSPQEARLSLGSSAVIGGGRAKLWYAGGDTGGDFEIQCSSERRYVQPSTDETYDACGVTVEFQGLEESKSGKLPKAKYRITWK